MSRAFDFVVVSVIWMICLVIHRIAVELFAPDKPLHEIAASATHFNAASKASLWFEILAVWVPLIAGAGILAWALVREYRRQAVTGARPGAVR